MHCYVSLVAMYVSKSRGFYGIVILVFNFIILANLKFYRLWYISIYFFAILLYELPATNIN